MPRKKKNGLSPARVPGLSHETGSSFTGYRSQGSVGAMASNFTSRTLLPNSDKERVIRSMQEMFSHLDPEVIYIVLSECDFKVEHAMDSLLELSVAAEGAAPLPPRVSGFELTAAALLNPQTPEFHPNRDPSNPLELPFSVPPTPPLREEFDQLIDQELETLTIQPQVKEEQDTGLYLSAAAPVSSLPLPPILQQALPELLQSSLEPGATQTSEGQPHPGETSVRQTSEALSPLDQLSFWGAEALKTQHSVLDFSHLTLETPATKLNPPLDLGTSSRPSAFQVYKKQGQSFTPSEGAWVTLSSRIVGGARSKVSTTSQEPPSNLAWNTDAPEFCPRVHGNQVPAFITPVAVNPSSWNTQSRPASHWLAQGPVSQAPLKPFATIPKSWAVPAATRGPVQHSRLRLEGRVLVLLRGAPGSGKSTLARAMLEHNSGGVVLSTDDYFSRHGEYRFDPFALGEAHEWNHGRAKEAFESGANPIIIDNTNMHGWEMKPYVAQALKHKYKVLFREPDTWWKNKPRELQRKTKHDVPVERIRRMLEGYERFVSVQAIMGSQPPEWKQLLHQDSRPSQPETETACPDLVGEPGLVQGSEMSHPHPQLPSAPPDVSSVECSEEMGTPGHSSHNSTESLHLLLRERGQENPPPPDKDDDMDFGELDSELDAQLELGCPGRDRGIPDCIVESVLNEDHHGDELPVAFSESIAQRVKRDRRSRKSDFDRPELSDLVKDTTQSEREAEVEVGMEGVEPEGAVEGEMVRGEGERGRPELLDFVGDWPSEGGLKQREVGRRRRPSEGKGDRGGEVAEEAGHHDNGSEMHLGPDVTEFQKLLDLIQTGVDSMLSPLSHSSGEETERGTVDCPNESHSNRLTAGEDQDVDGGNNDRAELPDCVLDWRAADLSLLNKSPQSAMFESGAGETKSTDMINREGSDHHTSEVGVEAVSGGLGSKTLSGSLSYLSADSPDSLDISEAKVSHDTEGSENNNSEVNGQSMDSSDKERRNCVDSGSLIGASAEADVSHSGEVSQSPVCDVSVETDSGSLIGGSQERKQRQSRRSGKQCKLALTFTQNCPSSSPKALKDEPQTTVQNLHTNHKDTELDSNPETDLRLDTKPNLDLDPVPIPKPDSQSQPQADSPTPMVDTGCSTQTDPQDFALLWRLNHHDNPDETPVAVSDLLGSIKVLSGNPSRFLPELSCVVSAAEAVHPSGHSEVPYRVVHEKGSQVEEKELGGAKSKLESLRILSRHFKLVSFDTLEDLYDKCHQDLEWTTNLLLDSGEKLFRNEDGEEEEEVGAGDEEYLNTFALCGSVDVAGDTEVFSIKLQEFHSEDVVNAEPSGGENVKIHESADVGSSSRLASVPAGGSDSYAGTTEGLGEDKKALRAPGIIEKGLGGFGYALSELMFRKEDDSDKRSRSDKSPQPLHNMLRAVREGEEGEISEQDVTSETLDWGLDSEGGACEGNRDDGGENGELKGENGEDEISRVDEVTWSLLAQLEEMERREGELEREERRSRHLDIQCVELKLPTELAIQLTELFGPVGIDPGACSTDDYAVRMDLNLAKLLHQKWKDTIQERQRLAALSYHLLQESSAHWGDPQAFKTGSMEGTGPAHFLIGADGYVSLGSQPEAQKGIPFMDHWSVSRPHVSLRDIMTEEQALQDIMERTRQSRSDLDRRDGAALLKENQLYALFPSIDRHFLQDIFRDHNYCLVQTEQFLRSLLDEGPVKTVVAPEFPRSEPQRTPSKEREKRQKAPEPDVSQYQDVEDPEYEDFRAEASMQRNRQLESLAKAAEAYRQGRKDVASFYAHQGNLHGQRMREANHRAAMQIFERVNSSLLPRNILDLHGLHVDEARQHLAQVLLDKTTEYQQGLCGPQLSIITGRGNHSQGGVARIRPAVIDYLTSQQYRFTEPKQGLLMVSLN